MTTETLQRDLISALLWEIAAGLRGFAETGASAAIDLGGLPLERADREALDETLGRGEITATLEAAGSSEVWETAYAGVWRVRHFGGDHVAVDQIEIGPCPKILLADRRDAGAAARRLTETLGETSGEAA